jgi:hypothetical protein
VAGLTVPPPREARSRAARPRCCGLRPLPVPASIAHGPMPTCPGRAAAGPVPVWEPGGRIPPRGCTTPQPPHASPAPGVTSPARGRPPGQPAPGGGPTAADRNEGGDANEPAPQPRHGDTQRPRPAGDPGGRGGVAAADRRTDRPPVRSDQQHPSAPPTAERQDPHARTDERTPVTDQTPTLSHPTPETGASTDRTDTATRHRTVRRHQSAGGARPVHSGRAGPARAVRSVRGSPARAGLAVHRSRPALADRGRCVFGSGDRPGPVPAPARTGLARGPGPGSGADRAPMARPCQGGGRLFPLLPPGDPQPGDVGPHALRSHTA